jgi:hypothetical protein
MPIDKLSSTQLYVPILQQVLDIFNRKLSLDMLDNASDYLKFAEDFKKEAFPATKPEHEDKTLNKYYLSELRSWEGKIIFKVDYLLEAELSKENDLFFFCNDKFNFFGSGFTKEEALKDFSEFFIHDYLSYKKTSVKQLTQDAQHLLDEYESVISAFEPA